MTESPHGSPAHTVLTAHTDVVRLVRALDFAARKHVHQRRKGEVEEPYVNHVAEVALLVAQATGGTDTDLIIAALLHDTVEDTQTTFTELSEAFGEDVARLVEEVTDDKNLLKEERKRLQIETAPKKSDRAKILKIADKTANLLALHHSPPKDWSDQRKAEYFEWANQVVAGCRGANHWIEAQFDAAHRNGWR